jgi:hypothetical protein
MRYGSGAVKGPSCGHRASGVGDSAWRCAAARRSGTAVRSPARKAPADSPMARPISGGMTAPPSAEPGIRSCGPRPPLRSAQPLSEPAADTSERSRTRTAAPRLSRYWGTPVGRAHRLPLRLSRHSAAVRSDPRACDPDVGHPLRCGRPPRADGAVFAIAFGVSALVD